MDTISNNILSLNVGSSSIKFGLYKIETALKLLASGKIVLNKHHCIFSSLNAQSLKKQESCVLIDDNFKIESYIINTLEENGYFNSIKVIGHRIVFGMGLSETQLITQDVLGHLKKLTDYDPEHLPASISLIESLISKFPTLAQVVCFDSFFHNTMPDVAKLLPLPLLLRNKGIIRYGFHGLSYAFIMNELKFLMGACATSGKIIIAHLGNGASLAAVKDGKSIDTSMGFTPSSGIMMSNRSGDVEPGLAWYLAKFENYNAEDFSNLFTHQSGLLAISETSSDMLQLLKIQYTDTRAASAIELFCYQTKKFVGAYSAILGGLDVLIFSGGIGENSCEVRGRICNNLQFLGIEIDDSKNANQEPIISTPSSKVTVRIIKSDEQIMIAKMANDFLKN